MAAPNGCGRAARHQSTRRIGHGRGRGRRPAPTGSTTGAPRTPGSGRRPARSSPAATWPSPSSPSTSASRSGACGRSSCCSSATTTASRPPRSSCSRPSPPRWAPSCACPTRSRSPSSAAGTGRSSPRPCWSCPACWPAWCCSPGVSFNAMLAVAAVAGVGGGNFSSSMANIDSFYPQRLKGWALGLNAGGGNLGVAAVQLVGLAVLGHGRQRQPQVDAGGLHPADRRRHDRAPRCSWTTSRTPPTRSGRCVT